MNFSSFFLILLGVNLTGVSVGMIIGYYINQSFNHYYWVYLSVPLLATGSLLMLYGTLKNK